MDTILGFDFGTKRIGVAVGDTLIKSAQALEIVPSDPKDARWSRIETLIKTWKPSLVVVGRPSYPDGAPHEMTRAAEKFARSLAGRFCVKTVMVDERYSSAVIEADASEHIDDLSACLILNQWFAENGK
ncbi:MAG TPA: Holliday junction resolvase RuvX [Sutterella sp.]|nr:Holliday junction resolvase RuvX [Sutterella sp.]